MTKCLVCENEIGENERAVWFLNATAICKNCEFKRIIVFHVALPGEQTGYYEKDITIIADMLYDADLGSGYTVIKEKMSAVKYYSLPEFAGF